MTDADFLRTVAKKRRQSGRQMVEVFATVGLLHCDLTVWPTRVVGRRNDRKLKFYMQLLNYRTGEQQGTSGGREALRLKQSNKKKNETIFFSIYINALYVSSVCFLKCCGIQCGRSF